MSKKKGWIMGLAMKAVPRRRLVRMAVKFSIGHADDMTDALADQARQKLGGEHSDWIDLANHAIDTGLLEVAEKIIGEEIPHTESIWSVRQVAKAALTVAKRRVPEFADTLNNWIDIPFVSEETEEEYEQALVAAFQERTLRWDAWINENL